MLLLLLLPPLNVLLVLVVDNCNFDGLLFVRVVLVLVLALVVSVSVAVDDNDSDVDEDIFR
jgi:hypothetical protein